MSNDIYFRGSREVFLRIIKYSPELKITNLEQLPAGKGCKYLIVIEGIDCYIAKSWKRNIPEKLLKTEFLVSFS